MAEALAALGTTTALLSLVFATIPTIAKAHRDIIDCTEQLRIYRLRTSTCEAKIATLLERCRGFEISESLESEDVVKTVLAIHKGLQARLQAYAITGTELNAWQKHKTFPRRITNELCSQPAKFFHSTLYALYKKKIIDEWVTGMEKAIESLEKLLQAELEMQTGGHHRILDTDAIKEVQNLKIFVAATTGLGTTLFNGTVGSSRTASIHDWALELRSPSTLNDVANWKYAELDLRLSFSGPRSRKEQDFTLQVSQPRFSTSLLLSRQQIEQAVLEQIGKASGSNSAPFLKCCLQDRRTRRTRPLGTLFREKQDLFSDPVWKSDQVSLVHGLVNWGLLLWNTRWTDSLCSCGLRFEKDAVSDESTQFLAMSKCLSTDCRSFSTRLQNLGLTLAEIILATPIRPVGTTLSTSESLYCEEFNGKTWKGIAPEEIAQRVCQKTKSIQFAEAISFCLTDISKLATGKFRPGYLLRLIEKIYTPIITWYEPESKQLAKRAKLAKRRKDKAKQDGWPEAGMDRRADSLHSESPLPSISTVWVEEVIA